MSRRARRDFLRLSALAGASAALPAPSASADAMRYRTLGRTGLKASEIGFGGYPIRDPDVIDYAIDRGITYVDTAQGYRGGDSEATIGKVMRRRRDEVTLTTKYQWRSAVRKEKMLADIDGSLKRLQTDHVDFVLVHQVGKPSDGEGVKRLQNPELFEAIQRAKAAGKVRHLGCSGHDGDLMEVMSYAIDSGHFDLVLMRYSFLDYAEQPALIRRAREKGVAVVAMKTLAGAKGMALDRYRGRGTSFKQAALRWVLSNPDVSSLIISIADRDQVDEYAAAVAAPLQRSDLDVLSAYAARHGHEVCRLCNRCEPACRAEIHVADVLRASMYASDYGEPEHGREAFLAIPARHRRFSACEGCVAPCLAACGYGVDVKNAIARARRTLA